MLADGSGDGDSDEKGSDGSGDLEVLSDSSDEKDGAENAEEHDFIGLMSDQRAEGVAVTSGDEEDDEYGCAGDADGDEDLLRATTDQKNCNQREVNGHHEVFEHKDGEDCRRFWRLHALEFGEKAGNDAGGCDEGDAAEEDGGQRRPAEKKSGEKTWREVKKEVDCRARGSHAKSFGEVLTGVLEAEHEEEQEHADFGTELDKPLGEVEREQPAISEGEAGQQVERDCRETKATGEPGEESQSYGDAA